MVVYRQFEIFKNFIFQKLRGKWWYIDNLKFSKISYFKIEGKMVVYRQFEIF